MPDIVTMRKQKTPWQRGKNDTLGALWKSQHTKRKTCHEEIPGGVTENENCKIQWDVMVH